MSLVLITLGLAVTGAVVVWPVLAARGVRWPAEAPSERDDVARAVSSLRDLEFARAAGTLAPEDYARLRARIERSAFDSAARAHAEPAPLRTIALAALLAGIAAVAVAVTLPREVGDRAPGRVLTGSGGGLITPTTLELERRALADANDIPIRLQLAEAYAGEGRASEAVAAYRAVLALDSQNVPALNALAVILFGAGETDAAEIAADRVLALRPRDPDALFLKGAARYRNQDFAGAVSAWEAYLQVAEFDQAAPAVRTLLDDARARARQP